MKKKILCISGAKWTAMSFGLLLAVFCILGMSFTPADEGGNVGDPSDSTYVTGPRRSHWDNSSTSCGTTTHRYNSTVDYAETKVQTTGYGSVAISTTETDNVTEPSSGNPRYVSSGTSNGNYAVIKWNSGLATETDKSSATYTSAQITAAHKKTFTITAEPISDDYYFAGWGTSTDESSITGEGCYDNPRTIVSDMKITDYTSGTKGSPDYSSTSFKDTYYAFFKERLPANITLKVPTDGMVKYSYESFSDLTLTEETTVTTKYDLTLVAVPDDGCRFYGWYTLDGTTENFISTSQTYTRAYPDDITIYAKFVSNSQATFTIKGTDQYFYDLGQACAAASSSTSKIVYPIEDGTVPAGNYTIPNGVTLLIPYEGTTLAKLTAPAYTKYDKTADVPSLSCYRKLILLEGANITVNTGGVICVGGQIASLGGGYFSGYPFGACGVLDMSNGGHIELNDNSILYAWGFIKGQDMDQGNNTIGVGTITAKSGSKIYEDFSGENRGGSACSDLANNKSYKTFPFQGYAIQNIEVPVTYNYGATLQVYTAMYIQGKIVKDFPLISSSSSLFLMKDAQSKVTKWYDPTTDLVCYELKGSTQLDAIKTNIYIDINSADFNLPISSNMHIIMDDCNMTLANPVQILPDAVIEIRANATVNLSSNLYLYDVDDWEKGVASLYFASFKNLTSHKNRGDGSSKASLNDAKLIVDGTLNVTGKIYSTTGGANICGNGGGKIIYPTSLASSSNLYQLWGSMGGTQTSTSITISSALASDAYLEPVSVNTANIHNEDESYTKSIASTTFHNVNGRWFAASAKDEKANHTYDFTYISSGAVSGTDGTSSTTDAVYSWDKTGMEARMKWANVTADACADWWHGQGDQAGWFYNWTMNSAWHQFQSTETEGLYSGSNNKIYTKTDCNWEELGETDVNCLYTIDGKKKALVDGHFIELEPNSEDAAFHEAADPTKYYICFEGCNWHAAAKYEGEKKAYVVDETTFIWFEENWMAVEREEPFFFTKDETNVTVYYEYIGSEWVIAQPYVEVINATEPPRKLLRFNEAITVASGKKNATITLLRDLVNITTPMTFTGANTTCTLDLNGHVAEVHVVGAGTSEIKMLTLNGASSTFTITDNTTDKKGELKLLASVNTETSTTRWTGIYVQNGSLVLQSGKVYVEHPFAWVSNSNTGFIRGILVASAKTFTMNGGTLEVVSDYNTYGIESASGTPTVNINHGTIECIATKKDSPYGIIGYGTINIKNDSYIHANAKASSSSRGVSVSAGSSYQGTVNVTGGTIYSEATGSAQGIYCGGTAVVTGDYNATTPNNTPKNRYYAKANISGGTITAICRTSTKSYGVLSYGTTTISGGTITSTVQKSNQNTAYGVYTAGGTTTISAGANITANAPTKAYGVTVTGANGDSNRGWPHVGVVNITGGTITANTTNTTTAYGLLVTGATWTINKTNSYSVFNGDYASAGTATVTGGTFNVNAKTTLSSGIAVDATKVLNDASATPKCTINGGYYKMTGTGDVLGCDASALPADFHINGGYYSHDGNLATYAASPKHVLTLAAGDANRPPYYYKVAEAYQVTFKTEDGTANIIDPIYQEVNTKPVCSTEPTKASTSTNSFTFDGWATEANGAKVYEPDGLPNVTSAGATYYAHFATTTLKYRVHLDATTNGGECATENIYVNPGTAVGTLPTATKYGYTFSGWFTAASGGTKLEATTVINANADYYAQFTVNSHTLTWDLAGGTVGTAGKIGSTTWPAKNATGIQSRSVAYGTVLTTIPVVTKTGYTFNRWDPVPTSSMPDNDVTYTALWTPATNTKYYVKHYQQNIDDDNYTLVETDELTGTTDAIITPARKSYDGFLTPNPQQLTIGAAGTSELAYYYDRVVYTINWNASANGGACATASTDVRHGANIALPAATKAGHILEGWYTKAEGGNKISDGAAVLQNYGTLYAQFIEVPTYKLTWDWNGGETSSTSYTAAGNLLAGDPIVYPEDNTMTRENYVFNGWSTNASTMPDEDLAITAQWIPAVASVTANNETTYHATIADAITAANSKSGATVTMLQNATTTSELTISAAMTIDLNGKAVSSTLASSTGVFKINASGITVTITDSDTGGTIDHTASLGSNLYGVFLNAGSLNITGGTISAKNNGSGRAYGLYTDGSATAVSMSGGTVEATSSAAFGMYSNSTSCTLTMTGGTFTGSGSGSRGIYVKNTTILSNATVTATGSDSHAIFAKSGTMTIHSGTYTATGSGAGYAIYFEAGTVTVNGGKFKGIAADIAKRNSAYNVILNGGYYVHETDLALKCSINHHVFDLTAAEKAVVGSEYNYKVAEAYTITFKDGNDNTIQSGLVEAGATPSYDGSTPTKTATAQYTYSFSGWDSEIVAVTEAKTYTAQFNSTVNKYTITFKNGDDELQSSEMEYGQTPEYTGETPVSTEDDEKWAHPFTGWSPEVTSVTGDAIYMAVFGPAEAKMYPVVWKDYDGTELYSSTKGWGWPIPSYEGSTPARAAEGNKIYTFIGWSEPVSVIEGGDVTFTARYELTIHTDDQSGNETIEITENEDVDVTVVPENGSMNVSEGTTFTTGDLVLEGTPTTSGEISGDGEVNAHRTATFKFSQPGGFKARTWYSVAVPWQVAVPHNAPAYTMPCDIYAKKGEGEFAQLKLGSTIDLIYYDGQERADHGHSDDCWKYVEDDGYNEVMLPGKAYMFFLLNDADTLRFVRKSGTPLRTPETNVALYGSGGTKNENWNGIANPATYHAYLDARKNSEDVILGYIYDGDKKDYKLVDMDTTKLVVGQAVYIQAPIAQTIVANPQEYANPSPANIPAPRRAAANDKITRYDVYLGADENKAVDRIVVRVDEEKEDEYVIGRDLVKFEVSSKVAQMWVNRYDDRLAMNTVAPVNNSAIYPLGIFVPQAGEYAIFSSCTIETGDNLFLTYDGRVIWNLSYAPYKMELAKGTTEGYGLRLIPGKAPANTTDIDIIGADDQNGVQKYLIDDMIIIIRGGEVYTITGQKAK